MGGSRVSSLGSSCASVSAHVTVTSQADALSHMGSVPTPQDGPPQPGSQLPLSPGAADAWADHPQGGLLHGGWGLFVGAVSHENASLCPQLFTQGSLKGGKGGH